MNAFILYVCPVIGNCLAVFMLLSPISAVLQIRRKQSLGAINPLPYPLTACNCVGWIVYGLVLANPWLIPANVVGLCAGIYFTLVSFPYADRKTQDIISGLFVVAALYFSVLAMVGVFALTQAQHQQAWGIQSVIVLMAYYGVPLTSMVEVVKTRNAASIYAPLAIGAIANGTMWGLYGFFGINDLNVGVPNTLGALLGLLQVGLRVLYGDKGASGSQGRTSLEAGGAGVAGRTPSESGTHLLGGHGKHVSFGQPSGQGRPLDGTHGGLNGIGS